MSHHPLSPEFRDRLRELLELDPTTPSGLRWKVSRGNARAGRPVGSLTTKGYWYATLGGRCYRIHRIIWALTHDEDPGDRQVDHIDGNPGNNDFANLRLATHGENNHNVKLPCTNTSGHKGLTRCSDQDKPSWRARIDFNGKRLSKSFPDHKYGDTETSKIAAAAWLAAKREELHGEFARHD